MHIARPSWNLQSMVISRMCLYFMVIISIRGKYTLSSLEYLPMMVFVQNKCNENTGMTFSAHNTFLEKPSSCTHWLIDCGDVNYWRDNICEERNFWIAEGVIRVRVVGYFVEYSAFSLVCRKMDSWWVWLFTL